MNPSNLPITTPLINGHHDVLDDFSKLISIKGKRCLCLGYDESQLQDYILKYEPASVVLLTLWDDHKDSSIDGFEVVIGDIGKRTPFEDNDFDFVITFSVLEHISDLNNAFIEIKRLLKPEGYFASLFGPAWSCHWGHHCYANPEEDLFNFCRWTMPSHMHLLSSAEEIKESYKSKGFNESECATIVEWCFETKNINRVFFEDYIELFYEHFYYVASIRMYADIDPVVLKLLREKYPKYKDFSTYGGAFLLKNLKA